MSPMGDTRRTTQQPSRAARAARALAVHEEARGDSPRRKVMDAFQMVLDLAQGLALLDVQSITCLLMLIPFVDHGGMDGVVVTLQSLADTCNFRVER